MEKRGKIILISSVLVVLIGTAILFILLTSKSVLSSEGFITLAKERGFLKGNPVSTLEEVNELCDLRCPDSFKTEANFQLGFLVCYCDAEHNYVIDTQTLEDLSMQQVEERIRR